MILPTDCVNSGLLLIKSICSVFFILDAFLKVLINNIIILK